MNESMYTTKRGHTGACKWKSSADIARPIFCKKLNSNICHLTKNKQTSPVATPFKICLEDKLLTS
jgi:hypothetical protein